VVPRFGVTSYLMKFAYISVSWQQIMFEQQTWKGRGKNAESSRKDKHSACNYRLVQFCVVSNKRRRTHFVSFERELQAAWSENIGCIPRLLCDGTSGNQFSSFCQMAELMHPIRGRQFSLLLSAKVCTSACVVEA